MQVTKILPLIALTVALIGCNKPVGELVGSRKAESFNEANPYGMLFIKKGSFMMGANTQSSIFDQQDNPVMVTVDAFWMDQTEITNSEYHQFVDWVRDSMAMTYLVEAGYTEYAIQPRDEDFDEENYRLNWRSKIPWKSKDEDIIDALAPLYYEDGTMRYNFLYYRYSWVNYDQIPSNRTRFEVASNTYPAGSIARVDTFWVSEEGEIKDSTINRPLREPKDLLTSKIIAVYPDTLVWAREFTMSYNDPLLKLYFSHPGYADYPVVGVTWEQAHAFCDWRTNLYRTTTGGEIAEFRLPTEAQWEYAARGGRKMAAYPWGGNYARDNKGCFLANFKPYRGVYNSDTGTATMKVAQFRPNDFGLYDMAGNVAEWTNSVYQNASNTFVSDLNPDFSYMARKDDPDNLKRKIVRGGSWRDISYFLQCGVRTYEYQYESRSDLGFRCVRAFYGTK